MTGAAERRRERIRAACRLLAERRAPDAADPAWLDEAQSALEDAYTSIGHQLLVDQPDIDPAELAELLEPQLEAIRDAAQRRGSQHAAQNLRRLLTRRTDRPTSPPLPPRPEPLPLPSPDPTPPGEHP